MEKTNMYILSIVGIVGVVAVVVLMLNAGEYNSADDSSLSNDISGQAIKTKLSAKIKDSDKDGVPDTKDKCPGFNDKEDADKDEIPNGCDEDADGDGYYNSDETTAGTNPYDAASYPGMTDSDSDGIADSFDLCEGYDDKADSDKDGTPDDCDLCPTGDDRVDTDLDGVPNKCDKCSGYDDNVDTDDDGTADGCDVCEGYDDTVDADGDGTPDGCDKADLTILGLNAVYFNITEDNNFTVNFTLENIGTESTSATNVPHLVSVAYLDSSGTVQTIMGYSPYFASPLVPSRVYTIKVGTAAVSSGLPEYVEEAIIEDILAGNPHDFEITVTADSASKVSESDETNNEYTETVTLTSADLVS